MDFSFYIAKRYLRSKSSQNAVNIINFITFLVIVIGSGALFIVLSGFAGLKTFSLSFSNTFDPDLKATPIVGKTFSISPEQEERLGAIEGVVSYAKELEERVYITHREKSDVAYIKGVDTYYSDVIAVDSMIYYGDWVINGQQGVAGLGIVNTLGISLNNYSSPLRVLALKPGKGALTPKSFRAETLYNELPMVISGAYAVEQDLDKKYIITDLEAVQALLEKDDRQVSGINLKLSETAQIDEVQKAIEDLFEGKLYVKDREEQNGTLYRMLNTENMATYLIFTLVIIIALFNVVGAIIMMILDKQQNSRTLYSLGTTLKTLRRIYFVQGVMVTTIGGLVGVFVASLLIWSQLWLGWFRITPSLAYPVEYDMMNVGIVLATIMVLGVIASKIASSRITKKLISES